MPILPLPKEDSSKLGATLSITTPVVLVKELLDNALDAGATTVVVFIAPNTVDRVEVRDNGHGIHHADFDALGRSGYTSKLKSLCELATVATSSLGFRGVALASINTMSDVIITTRTPDEPVAEVLRLVDGGGIKREGHKGNPVGTVVCVNNLFAKFPVRQRAMIKEAPKTITKIKELLQSYAFARHQTKLAFRVLGKPESTWCYTGNEGSGVKEVASQIFGPETASHCNSVAYANLGAVIEERGRGRESTLPLSFEGLLPRPGGDFHKLIGVFISISSRPILSTRATTSTLSQQRMMLCFLMRSS
ncbi:histidine kinase-like ATPase [Podospora aff. communis PSN243]|uniref:Histidine kinase-like ATPase n=1 Tax=Podospora aff. communis PSN243 TaxID=3040156 RepID=A0AAV9GMC3_9PEZI|nr:histidine kinase-like ATPase [Podospora aff. communis PSN243]